MVTIICGLGDGLGVVRVKKFSSRIGDEMIRGDSCWEDVLHLSSVSHSYYEIGGFSYLFTCLCYKACM